MKKQIILDYRNPQNINDNVWFYANPKSFDFVVWVKIGDRKQATQFRLNHKKIKHYLTPPRL